LVEAIAKSLYRELDESAHGLCVKDREAQDGGGGREAGAMVVIDVMEERVVNEIHAVRELADPAQRA